MKQVFATAAVAGVSSALSFTEMWNKTLTGLKYRQREGVIDPNGYKVIANSVIDDLGYDTIANAEFNWGIRVTSIVNEDSGDTIMILQHIFQSKILHADEMTFDIAFTSAGDINNNKVIGPLGFDGHRCKLKNDTRNNSFWITTVEDGHYLTGAVDDWVKDSVLTKTNLGQDWYVEKDDVDLDNHLCVEPTTDENWGDLYEGYFACKAIRCEIRRNFNTADFYDYDFVTNGNTESLDIPVGRAKLLINQ